MKLVKTIVATALLSLFCTEYALSEPRNGFGLNAGYVNHARDCGGCTAFSTNGISVGLDYQFATSENISLSPFLMSSSESVSGFNVGHGIAGGQIRYWSGAYFYGAHLASYSEVAINNGATISGTGPGFGLVTGWENPDGGMFYMTQLDSATIKYSGLRDIKFTGLRLSLGYRWK